MKIQPITRKERFLYEIVGWGETAPEKPLTPEEFFFAAILGEAVQTPEPLTRYQMYLAKIAGRNISVPKPLTRLELFLAKAAEMDVVTPVPLTKEEIFWANYKGREQIIEGIPPLTFKSNGANLSNYRIYGNTVNGESVGDKTANLFDESKITSEIIIDSDGSASPNNNWRCSDYIDVLSMSTISILWESDSPYFQAKLAFYGSGKEFISVQNIGKNNTYSATAEIPNGSAFMRFSYSIVVAGQPANRRKIQIVEGSISTIPYEPYGYRVPITVNSGTVNIYLDEQLVKSGDDADYIDYDTQKRYNADGTSQSIELPTLQTVEGTNTLSVETTVQPSKVMIKTGKFGTHKVRYYDSDGTFLSAEDVKDGTNAQGFTPTKASTAQYKYTFVGWSTTKGSTTAETGVLSDITADKSLYAVFSQSLRTFTVYFYNGSTLLQTAENVQYGGTATYTGETPIKDGFTFSGWQPSNVNITADTSCYAQFVEG